MVRTLVSPPQHAAVTAHTYSIATIISDNSFMTSLNNTQPSDESITNGQLGERTIASTGQEPPRQVLTSCYDLFGAKVNKTTTVDREKKCPKNSVTYSTFSVRYVVIKWSISKNLTLFTALKMRFMENRTSDTEN